MDHCLFCDRELGPGTRPAYDPWLGRLWRVCPHCQRWNVVPLEDRWERLEALERATRDSGRTVLRTEHLDLVEAGGRQVLRVGRAPRPELAGWRYGDVLPAVGRRGLFAWLRRVILGLPTSPFGYGAGYGQLLAGTDTEQKRWFASPFLDDAPTLTAAFLHVPLAETCPSCGAPLALAPWSFQTLRLTGGSGADTPLLLATCGVCRDDVAVPVPAARGALRLGLGIVTRRLRDRGIVGAAADVVDRADGPEGLLIALGREASTLGELDPDRRLALAIALDEQSEAELLEAEWREAEELAAIMDRDLTHVEGFEEFRRRILG
ncbi:MAG: hypothetical protein R3314_01690 [Longimicrobiales bacterium]|nr:hypothetical protein [Longimicrobiales bacterium]